MIANLPHDTVPGARIGFLADTHVRMEDGSDLPGEVLEAFQGVDLIVHLGDLGHTGVLDLLATVAPVLATRNVRADEASDGRIAAQDRIIEINGVLIGATFELAHGLENRPAPGEMPPFEGSVESLVLTRFGVAVDVVAFGGTHAELQQEREGVLFFNPGSPTLSATHPRGELGTVAILDVSTGEPSVRIVSLVRKG